MVKFYLLLLGISVAFALLMVTAHAAPSNNNNDDTLGHPDSDHSASNANQQNCIYSDSTLQGQVDTGCTWPGTIMLFCATIIITNSIFFHFFGARSSAAAVSIPWAIIMRCLDPDRTACLAPVHSFVTLA